MPKKIVVPKVFFLLKFFFQFLFEQIFFTKKNSNNLCCKHFSANILFSPLYFVKFFFFFAKMFFLLTVFVSPTFLVCQKGEEKLLPATSKTTVKRFFVSRMRDYFLKALVLFQTEWSQCEFFQIFADSGLWYKSVIESQCLWRSVSVYLLVCHKCCNC